MRLAKKALILVLLFNSVLFCLAQSEVVAEPQKVLVIGAMASGYDCAGRYLTDEWSPLKSAEYARLEKLAEKGEYELYTENPAKFEYDLSENFHHVTSTLLTTPPEYSGMFDFVLHDWSTLKYLDSDLTANLVKGISLLKLGGSMLIYLRDCYCGGLTLRDKLAVLETSDPRPLVPLLQPAFYFLEGGEKESTNFQARPTYLPLTYENTVDENLANVQKLIAYLRGAGRANLNKPQKINSGQGVTSPDYEATVASLEKKLIEYAQTITPQNLESFLNSKLDATLRVQVSVIRTDSTEMDDLNHLYQEVFPPKQLAKMASNSKAFIKIMRVK